VEALDGTSMANIVADVSPAFFAVELDGLLEELVFVFIPFPSFEFSCLGNIL
jgi:hypothetical protein